MRPSAGLRVLARLGRAPRIWWAMVPLALVALILSAGYVTLAALSLTPEQEVARDFGEHGASIGFGTRPVAPGSDTMHRLTTAVRDAGFDDVEPTLVWLGVRWEGEPVVMREADWSGRPFPARYELAAGEWADRAGEVVVTARDEADLPEVGTRMPMLSGRVPLRVVGVAVDPYTDSTVSLLVGPGTWAAASPATTEAFPAIDAFPLLYWDGRRELVMIETVTAALGRPGAGPSARTVRASVERADDVAAQPDADAGNPLAYRIPGLVLPLIGGGTALALALPVLIRQSSRLRAAGAGPGISQWLPVAATVVPAGRAILLGGGIGGLLGLAVRPLLQQVHHQPLSPWVVPLDPLLRCLLLGLAVLPLGVPALRRPRPLRAGHEGAGVRRLRRGLAIVAACGCLLALPGASSPTPAMLLAALVVVAVAAAAPDLLAVLLRRMPEDGWRRRLNVRQLSASGAGRQTVVLTTVVVGCCTAFTVLLSTMIATQSDRQSPPVLPGQVLVADRASPLLPVPAAASRVLRAADLGPAVTRRISFVARGSRSDPTTGAASVDDLDGLLFVADDLATARALLGTTWDAASETVLARGGVLRWVDDPAPSEHQVTVRQRGLSDPLALTGLDRPRLRADWANGAAALTLAETASAHRLPVRYGGVVLTGGEDRLADDLQARLVEAGQDEALVTGYAEPPPPIPNAALLATAALLALTCVVLVGGSTAARVRELRPTAGQLLAQGVAPGWARRSILTQELTLLGVGGVLGLLAGILPILWSVPRFSGLWTVSIPWTQLALLLAVTGAACLIGAAGSARRLRPELLGPR